MTISMHVAINRLRRTTSVALLAAALGALTASFSHAQPKHGAAASDPARLTYAYDESGRLSAIVFGDTLRVAYSYDASGNVIGVNAESVVSVAGLTDLPRSFGIHPNYPNPFNPQTVIRYDVPRQAHVDLSVYDMLGRRVRVLYSGDHAAGFHEIRWDGRSDAGHDVATGVYLYRLRSEGFTQTRKMLLVR